METDGQVIHPLMGTPQGGSVSPILANVYLHNVLDIWFEEIVQTHCTGHAYLCRYADDLSARFSITKMHSAFIKALIQRLARFGLEVAEDKTQIIEFSHCKALAKAKFDFLGFEFRWYVGWKGKSLLKRRTLRDKLRTSIVNFKSWLKKYCGLPKEVLFAKLNRKLLGYYNYYGVTGNSQSLSSFVYHVTKLLYKWLNRRSQRKSYNWIGFNELLNYFGIAKPRILHAL